MSSLVLRLQKLFQAPEDPPTIHAIWNEKFQGMVQIFWKHGRVAGVGAQYGSAPDLANALAE